MMDNLINKPGVGKFRAPVMPMPARRVMSPQISLQRTRISLTNKNYSQAQSPSQRGMAKIRDQNRRS
jgi:hypothetical protein